MAILPVSIDATGAVAGGVVYRRATQGVVADSVAAAASVRGVSTAMIGMRSSMLAVLPFLLPFVGGMAAIGAASPAGTIREFELSLAQLEGVVTTSNQTFEERVSIMERLERAAREAGATTQFTASQAAQTELILSRAGLAPTETTAALGPTLDLAVAAQVDLARSGDIAVSTLRQFNIAAADTAHVSDVLVNTTNRTNTNLEELAENLKLSGPFASALGQDLETTAAAAGVLADFALKASIGGTSLRGTLASLTKTTDDGRRELARYGLTLDDVSVAQNGLIPVLERLRDVGLGDDAFSLATVFGRRFAAGARGLILGVDKIEELAEANRNASGTAQRAAEINRDSLDGSIKTLVSSVEELSLKLGEAGLNASLRDVAESLTGLARGVGDTSEAFKGAFGDEVASALISSLTPLKSLSDTIGVIKSGIEEISAITPFLDNPFGNALIDLSGGRTRFDVLNEANRRRDEARDATPPSDPVDDAAERANQLIAQRQAELERDANARIAVASRILDIERDIQLARGVGPAVREQLQVEREIEGLRQSGVQDLLPAELDLLREKVRILQETGDIRTEEQRKIDLAREGVREETIQSVQRNAARGAIVGDILARGAEDYVFNLKEGREVLRDTLLDLQRFAFQETVGNALRGLFQGLGTLIGFSGSGLFSQGDSGGGFFGRPFASGGRISSPSVLFNSGTGKFHRVAESGPEDIVPANAPGRRGATHIHVTSMAPRRRGRRDRASAAQIARDVQSSLAVYDF